MATQKELLERAFIESGLSKTRLAKMLELANGSVALHPYFSGKRKIGPDLGARLAKALNQSPDYFVEPDKTAARIARNERLYSEFLATPVGGSMSDEESAAVQRLLPVLTNPTVHWLTALVFHLRGQGPMPPVSDAEMKNAVRIVPKNK